MTLMSFPEMEEDEGVEAEAEVVADHGVSLTDLAVLKKTKKKVPIIRHQDGQVSTIFPTVINANNTKRLDRFTNIIFES